MSRKKEAVPVPAALPDLTTTREVINALKQLYMEKIRPIEVAYNFAEVQTWPQFCVAAL
jgi:N-terminal EH-domain containing protein